MKRIPVTLILFLSGMLTAIPIVFPRLFVVGIVSFALPAYFEYTLSEKPCSYIRTYLRGLAYFMGFGVAVFSWFCSMYPLEFTGLSKPAAIAVVCAGWFGLSLLQALFWAFLFVVLRLMARLCRVSSHRTLYSLVFACLYVVFEWMSTKTWAAVPWGRLAVGQTDFLPMIQIASVLGSYAVSFVLVFFGAALGVGIAEYRKGMAHASFRPLALAAAVLALNLTFGMIRALSYEVLDNSRTVRVSAVQGNISSKDKWSEDSLRITKEKYSDATMAASADGAVITVFPETPITYNVDGSNGEYVRNYYEVLARKAGCSIITGAFTKNAENISENSVISVSPREGILPVKYVKRHLVPFGEYVPMRSLISAIFPPLSDISMLSSDLAEGDEATILDTEYGKIAPLICFDSIYETLALDSVRAGGELITLSTNDSWFDDSSAVWQHNRHAVLRSVECGRYTVRAANTGVSSIISPTGEVLDTLAPLVDGYITADVHMISEKTVYTLIGNAFVPVCFIGVILMSVYCRACRTKTEEDA